MVRVRIFVEGGSKGNRNDNLFRTAWMKFFASAGLAGRLPTVVRCGDGGNALRRFSIAVREAGEDELPILLVDSEGPVRLDQTTWQHLQDNDGWQRPARADENSAFLMVQAMEAWLLADREALRDYFGQGFNESRLPSQTDPELIPVVRLESSLRAASADCRRRYDKGSISFDILGRVNAGVVESRCRRAKALLDYLRAL